MMNNKNRILSFMIFIIFSFVIFSSACYIAVHTDHVCSGENCSVCIELAECSHVLHTVNAEAAGVIKLMLLLITVAALIKAVIRVYSEHDTLVSLKVELLS
jgi:hypothetical protein